MSLQLVPVDFDSACRFVAMWHRHHTPPIGHKFSIGVAVDQELVGVLMVGRPGARAYDDGRTLEVTRSATDGTQNANSMLYGAAWRAASALGYRRLITYTQEGEAGSSLRAAGWRVIAQRPPRKGWDTPSRPRDDKHPLSIARTLWEDIVTSLSFFVPGSPSAQGSKRHVGNGRMVDMNKNLQPWRDSITYAARQAAQDKLNWRDQHGPAFTGPVQVHLEAIYPRPKSHFRTGRQAALLRADAPYYKTSAPDADKVARAACDAITASGLWRDDAYVADLSITKHYADRGTPGLHLSLREIT